MQLVFIAHRRGAAFQIGNVRPSISDDQRAFELPRAFGIDAEIGGKLHRAAHALRDVDKAAIGEDSAIQSSEEIIALRHDGAQIFLHQFGVSLHSLTDRAEDDAIFFQPILEGGGNRNAVEYSIHRDRHAPFGGAFAGAFNSRQNRLFLQRDSKLFIGAQQFRIHLIQGFWPHLLLRCGVVIGILVINRRILHRRPARFFHFLPGSEGAQAPFQQPGRFFLLGADKAHNVFG